MVALESEKYTLEYHSVPVPYVPSLKFELGQDSLPSTDVLLIHLATVASCFRESADFSAACS
jgi:hypothetical protein